MAGTLMLAIYLFKKINPRTNDHRISCFIQTGIQAPGFQRVCWGHWRMICVFRLKKRLPPQMMNLIVLDLMLAQQAKMSTLNMRYLKSESPQDFFNIYGLKQSESTACPAAKVSHVDGTLK